MNSGNSPAQPQQTPEQKPSKLPILLITGLSISLLLIIAYTVWEIFDDRKTIVSAAEIQTQGYARALKEHAERTFSEVDLVLQSSIRQLEAAGPREREDERYLRQLLLRTSSQAPQIAALALVDSSGQLRLVSTAETRELPDVADRSYSRFHKEDMKNRLFITPPFKSRVTGKWRFALSRRISTASGGFAGTMVAALDISYFEDLYAALASDRNARYTLATIPGDYLVLVPEAHNIYGTGKRTLADFRKMVEQRVSGTYHRSRSNVFGEERVVSYHRLDNFPVVAIMSFNLKDVLADWKRTAIQTSLVLSVLISLIVLLSLKLLNQVKLLDRKVQERTAMLSVANSFLENEIEERKRIEESLLENQARLDNLAGELSIAEDRERGRIASELHDEVCQRLILCKIRLDEFLSEAGADIPLKNLYDTEKLLEQSIQDIRTLTFQMRPPVLASAGLVSALRWLGDEFLRDYSLDVKFDCKGCGSSLEELKFEISSSLFQIIRELLLNVVKHSGGKTVMLSLNLTPSHLQVSIMDNGKGFDSKKQPRISPKGGFGLYSIRQKIEYLGGSFQVESKPGAGTSVEISLPLKPELFKESGNEP